MFTEDLFDSVLIGIKLCLSTARTSRGHSLQCEKMDTALGSEQSCAHGAQKSQHLDPSLALCVFCISLSSLFLSPLLNVTGLES